MAAIPQPLTPPHLALLGFFGQCRLSLSLQPHAVCGIQPSQPVGRQAGNLGGKGLRRRRLGLVGGARGQLRDDQRGRIDVGGGALHSRRSQQ